MTMVIRSGVLANIGVDPDVLINCSVERSKKLLKAESIIEIMPIRGNN